MTAADQQLLQDTKQYVTEYFATRIGPDFLFHNLQHTEEVVKAAELLADYYQLPDEDRLPLLLAGWFHDTGYSGGFAKDHEDLSKNIAARFLS
jgi:predicted metal-dependent HD superfamily phosphohydrolase